MRQFINVSSQLALRKKLFKLPVGELY